MKIKKNERNIKMMGRKFVFDKDSVGMLDYASGELVGLKSSQFLVRDDSGNISVLKKRDFNTQLQLTGGSMVIVDYSTPVKMLVRMAKKHTQSPEKYTEEWFRLRQDEAAQNVKK
jgi:hypothetical protein